MSNTRHKFLFAVLKPIVRVYARLKFGFTYQKLKKKDLPEKYLVLSNHTTDYDPIFIGMALPGHSYFVASEHIARFKVYNLLKWVFNPIIRYKGTVASSTVMDVLRRVRKGNNVAIMAEGVRTFDGVTCPILPSTAKLVKAAKCGLVTYKLTGGYFASPLWSSSGNTRKGNPAIALCTAVKGKLFLVLFLPCVIRRQKIQPPALLHFLFYFAKFFYNFSHKIPLFFKIHPRSLFYNSLTTISPRVSL